MAHALLGWELGANLGHITKLRAIARELVAQGHRVTFALRELDEVDGLLDPALGSLYQAPFMAGAKPNAVKRQISYASLLHNCGFGEPKGLASRVRAWRTIMVERGVDCVFADHSPTLLLAARTLGLRRIQFGSGFCVPPNLSPFPAWDASQTTDVAAILARNEASILAVTNAALERLKLTPLTRVQDIFEGTRSLVTSYRELDHYRVEREEPYIGLPDFSYGATVTWPRPRAPRIFAYLRPTARLPAMMEALKQVKAHVLVRVGGVPAASLSRYARPNLMVVDANVSMRQAAESCDAYVNYSAHGTLVEMLLAGKPGLLLPDSVERMLVARRVGELGAGLVVMPQPEPDLSALLAQLIDDPSLRQSAEQFRARYQSLDRADVVRRIAAEGTSAM